MGCEGQIHIVRVEDVESAWPEWRTLFDAMPNGYTNEIGGVKYAHIYSGDNLCVSPFNVTDCYTMGWTPEQRERLEAFIVWWKKHAEWWEVWT